jgi:hypothetical protein
VTVRDLPRSSTSHRRTKTSTRGFVEASVSPISGEPITSRGAVSGSPVNSSVVAALAATLIPAPGAERVERATAGVGVGSARS